MRPRLLLKVRACRGELGEERPQRKVNGGEQAKKSRQRGASRGETRRGEQAEESKQRRASLATRRQSKERRAKSKNWADGSRRPAHSPHIAANIALAHSLHIGGFFIIFLLRPLSLAAPLLQLLTTTGGACDSASTGRNTNQNPSALGGSVRAPFRIGYTPSPSPPAKWTH